jgi:hypothetical protein
VTEGRLIDCKACEKPISWKAEVCPHCRNKKVGGLFEISQWVLGGLCVLLGFTAIATNGVLEVLLFILAVLLVR